MDDSMTDILRREIGGLRQEVSRLELATATARGDGMVAGERRERARIRRGLVLWLDRQEDIGGELEDRFLAALDEILPEEG